EIVDADAPDLLTMRSDESVMRFLDRPRATGIEDAATLIKRMRDDLALRSGITWGVSLKDQGLLIGTIGFWRIMPEHFRAEIGYLLHADYHAKGLMHEAMKPVLDYGFATMGLHSVEANVNPSNVASIRLLEKNGFTREAYFRENYFYNGRFIDSAIYSLLAGS
ncbi:MAG TPA: GNAT family N-acetyltransferase, partial [Flavisolibacter sp.]